MRFVLAACLALALAACAATPRAGNIDEMCRNDMLTQFIGSQASEQLGRDILTASGAKVIRWVPKGSAVTMDFRGDRVTVALDENNKVERASCG
nr:I78 family peptidase inhibitor [uncultured Sphingomonas sp.]